MLKKTTHKQIFKKTQINRYKKLLFAELLISLGEWLQYITPKSYQKA